MKISSICKKVFPIVAIVFIVYFIYIIYGQIGGNTKEAFNNTNIEKKDNKEVNKQINKEKNKGKQNKSNKKLSIVPPSRGVVSSGYGKRWGKMHKGVDIAAPIGTTVIATLNGEVTYAGWQEGYGKVIKIKHEKEIETVYGHLSVINVVKGQTVKKGEKIGEVGSTGNSTGPHIHFEIRVNGLPNNPMNYINNN